MKKYFSLLLPLVFVISVTPLRAACGSCEGETKAADTAPAAQCPVTKKTCDQAAECPVKKEQCDAAAQCPVEKKAKCKVKCPLQSKTCKKSLADRVACLEACLKNANAGDAGSPFPSKSQGSGGKKCGLTSKCAIAD